MMAKIAFFLTWISGMFFGVFLHIIFSGVK